MIESLQKILPWIATLSFAPKLAISIVILGIAGLALTLLWSKQPNVDYPEAKNHKPGAVEQRPLPKFVVGNDREEIRRLNGVRELTPLEDGLSLDKLPLGVFGYTTAWALPSDPSSVKDGTGGYGFSFNKSPGGTAVTEIHKSESNETYVIVYVSEEVRIKLEDPSRKISVSGIVFFNPYQENDKLIGVPVRRITKWNNRHPNDIGYIADVEII